MTRYALIVERLPFPKLNLYLKIVVVITRSLIATVVSRPRPDCLLSLLLLVHRLTYARFIFFPFYLLIIILTYSEFEKVSFYVLFYSILLNALSPIGYSVY